MTSPDPRDVLYSPTTSALLLVGDDGASLARAAAAAESMGIAVSARVGIRDALAGLAEGMPPRGVFVEVGAEMLDEETTLDLERLLRRLEADATAGRVAGVISTTTRHIDLVAALSPHARIQQLADASDADRALALNVVSRAGGSAVRESSNSRADAAQLRALSLEVSRISSALARMSTGVPLPGPGGGLQAGEPLGASQAPREDAARLRRIIRLRRLRGRYFDPALFADPVWDMLLDLAAAHIEGKRVAVSSLCIAAAVPPTTALRWIRLLTDNGILVRQADPTDGRRVFIELGEGALAGMRGYLDALGGL